MTAASVSATGIVKRISDRLVLDGVTLGAHGGIVTVLGPNGAGKTTLLRCLSTVTRPDSGEVHIDGIDTAHESGLIEVRRRLGYLPQRTDCRNESRVFDAVDYIAALKGEADERRRRRLVFDALDAVGLSEVIALRIDALSGGMRRRVAIAQALLGTPRLLVLDEPATGFDPDERLRLRALLTERRRSTTIVMSTHLTDEAAFSDTVVVVADGRVRFAGTPQELAARATGRAWVQADLPPPGTRAAWRLADGRWRCLGVPPPGATVVDATLEDGYLLTVGQH